MVKIYSELIKKGLKSIEDVHIRIKEQVKQVLIELDLPDLAQ